MSRSYDFNERLAMSQGQSISDNAEDVLMEIIPAAEKVEPSTEKEDRDGTDRWVVLSTGQRISVDLKVRTEDWAIKGRDDLALERWSVVERRIAGWTRDLGKRTDYVLWFWKDTHRWCFIPFQLLLSVFLDHCDEWCARYGTHQQHTPRGDGYHSECVFVPRQVVWRAIYEQFGGNGTVGVVR